MTSGRRSGACVLDCCAARGSTPTTAVSRIDATTRNLIGEAPQSTFIIEQSTIHNPQSTIRRSAVPNPQSAVDPLVPHLSLNSLDDPLELLDQLAAASL